MTFYSVKNVPELLWKMFRSYSGKCSEAAVENVPQLKIGYGVRCH
jgi:hypothetical protein